MPITTDACLNSWSDWKQAKNGREKSKKMEQIITFWSLELHSFQFELRKLFRLEARRLEKTSKAVQLF